MTTIERKVEKGIKIDGFCKRKHGATKFYSYPNGKAAPRCAECSKEFRANRRKDPEIQKYDTLYYENNKERITKMSKEWALNNPGKQTERLHKFKTEFMQNNYDQIVSIYNLIGIKFNETNAKRLLEYGCSLEENLDKIKRKCKEAKLSQFRALEVWKQSSIVKYKYRVRETFDSQTQELKDKINQEAIDLAMVFVIKKEVELNLL